MSVMTAIWWDGSQIYEQRSRSRRGAARRRRKAPVDDRELIPADLEKSWTLPGSQAMLGWGLPCCMSCSPGSTTIVEMLHKTHPELGDDDTFDKARLINAALIAKIHTVEWTPAVISHPTYATGDEDQLVGFGWERSDPSVRRSPPAISSAAFPARRPTTTVFRTR
jgi:hypothetical protein